MSIATHPKLKSGALIAASAAALIIAGCANTDGMKTSTAGTAKIHCAGVNACKGASDCKAANNACKGMNACKGQGFLSLDSAECKTRGGTVM